MYPEYGGTREIPSESGESPKAKYREGKVKSTPEGSERDPETVCLQIVRAR